MSRLLRVACIAGARPNFMKIAPVMRALQAAPELEGVVIHTGQHYDKAMSSVFFGELGIPEPLMNLGVGSSGHGEQTGQIMVAFERALDEIQPHLVLVVGDVNSTIACALVATKRGIPVAHVEAGLRSYDRQMPEVINRILTDQISDFLFTTEESAADNLANEGVDRARVHFTGNTMIDTLAYMQPSLDGAEIRGQLGLNGQFAMVTFHRPSNVDDKRILSEVVDLLREESHRVDLVFPVHPRTRRHLEEFELWSSLDREQRIHLVGPLPYTQFVGLLRDSMFVLTDSGGIQEETTWLGIPCLTQRTSTERPITVSMGTNTLLGEDFQATRTAIESILDGSYKTGTCPPLWDGHCAERIVEILARELPRSA